MERIEKTIYEDRYVLRRNESILDFMEDAPFGGGNGDSENMLGFFNTENTGCRMYRENFLKFPKKSYYEVEDVKAHAKELGFKHYAWVSFYQENGWEGVRVDVDADTFNKRPNNCVSGGSDGLVYLLFANEVKEFELFETLLQEYLNEGSWVIEIYDRKEEDYTEDQFWTLGNWEARDKFNKHMKEKYGFTDEQLGEV